MFFTNACKPAKDTSVDKKPYFNVTPKNKDNKTREETCKSIPGQEFDGVMDDVRLYDRALSEAELLDLFDDEL
jgi:hypothetical protein